MKMRKFRIKGREYHIGRVRVICGNGYHRKTFITQEFY